MKPTHSKPTATTAPTKGKVRPSPFALSFATLAGLPPGPKPTAPAASATTKRLAPAVKAAPCFDALAGVRVDRPVYVPPPAAPAPKEDPAAIERRLHANMQAALPLRQQRR